MVSRVFSAGLDGINGYIVTVECLLSGGLPRLDVVGLPTGAVSEAGERVRAAAKSCSFDWPVSRLTVNLAPADTRKAGTAFDLPILLSILAAAGEINALPQDALFFGELSLSGELRPVRGALSMALAARSADFRAVYVPAANAQEASYADSLTVYPVRTLSELINHLSGRKQLVPCPPPPEPKPAEHDLDYAHVLGQHLVKRALEVAAAGGHNVLLSGSPGSGKSMMAKRFSSILPPLSHDERLDVIRVWSAVGRAQEAVERAERPFRAPHHSSSAAALAGGSGSPGRLPLPGEITLAHRGVLFLDELPEFRRDALEVLRQPMEDGKLTIARAAGQVTYPADFQLIAAMNPSVRAAGTAQTAAPARRSACSSICAVCPGRCSTASTSRSPYSRSSTRRSQPAAAHRRKARRPSAPVCSLPGSGSMTGRARTSATPPFRPRFSRSSVR